MSFDPFEGDSFAENPEPRCPCILLLDVSASMLGDPIVRLRSGLETFRAELCSDPLASKRVEVSIITFGGGVETPVRFTTPDRLECPTLSACGETPMGAAIITAIEMLRARKDEYRRSGIAFYRPWVFLLTDGAPTDKWSAAATAIREGEGSNSFSFFAVGVPPANLKVLSELSARPPLRLDALRFADLFAWLSNSLRSVSCSRPGQRVPLTNPLEERGWACAPETVPAGSTERREILDVAIVTARCTQSRSTFRIRVEKSSDEKWSATYSEKCDETAGRDRSARQIPPFDLAPSYSGCPSCNRREFFVCDCDGIACWNGRMSVICPWCDHRVRLGGTVTKMGAGRG